jgi:hypothetical protein
MKRPGNRYLQHVTFLIAGIGTGLILCEVAIFALGQPRFYKAHTFPPQFSIFTKSNPDGRVVKCCDKNGRCLVDFTTW